MRNSSILFILSALVVGLFFTSCKKFQGPTTVMTTPNPLEVHGDSIEYTTKVKIAPKSGMKKKGVYTGAPALRNGAEAFKTDNIVIQGAQNPNVKKQGAELSKRYKMAYSDRMNGGALRMDNTYQKNAKKPNKVKDVNDSENMAKCCITTSRMVWDAEYYILTAKDRNEYRKVVPLRLEAKFNFPKNIDKIQSEDYNKSDIVSIGEFINKRLPATKITIVGFASPEGSLKRNVELSVNRSKEVQKWLMEQLKKAGYTLYLDSTFFAISTTSEDWDGFKQNVKSSPKFGEYASQIFEIVSSGITEDEKESKIMALVGGARNPEVEALLAPLRRATIVMEGQEPRRTDAQIDSIGDAFVAGKVSGNIKDIYEKEEWLYAIGRMDSWKDKKAHLAAFVQAYPSDYRGLNDYGAILASEGNMDEGMKNLESAASNKRGDNAVLNNTGIIQRVKGKKADARRSFESSLSAQNTGEAAFNLGVVLAGQAAYAQAIDRFNTTRTLKGSEYNVGLCKLMMDDKSGARAAFESSAKAYPEYTQGYYMLAVTGVRMNDKDLWTLNLKKAVDGNRRFADMAKSDLEFDKVRETSEFKAIVK
jgi:outer membrane protein OmpA-like peptidoglycan-associated protein/Tfp pilus assembly protein PilF